MTKTGSIIGLGFLLVTSTATMADVFDGKLDLFTVEDQKEAKNDLWLENIKVVPAEKIIPAAKIVPAEKLLPAAKVGEPEHEEEKTEAEKEEELSDNVKEALKKFAQKAGEIRRQRMKPDLEGILKDIGVNAKLDAPSLEKLSAVIPAAMDASMKDWEDKFCEWLSPYLQKNANPLQQLESWRPEDMVSETPQFTQIAPGKTTVWLEAVKATLTADQKTALAAYEATEWDRMQEEITPYLDTCVEQTKELWSNSMESRISEITRYVTLDEERLKNLKKTADEAVKLSLEDWRGRVREKLIAMDDKSRKTMMAQNRPMGVDPKGKTVLPEKQAPWLSARKKLLTEAEVLTLEQGEKQVKERRVDALAMLLLAELDSWLGLNTAQREKILPLARPRLMDLPKEFFEAGIQGNYHSLEMNNLLTKLKKIPAKDLELLLEPGQLKRWKDTTPGHIHGNRGNFEQSEGDGIVVKPEDITDPMEQERFTSMVLAKQAIRVKRSYYEQMEAQLENIIRVTALEPAASAVLRTAAKGAAERLAEPTMLQLDQYGHQQLQGVKPKDVAARLNNLNMPGFQDRHGTKDPPLWTATLRRVLSPEQQALWQKEEDASSEWRYRSLGAFVASEVGKHVTISPDKEELLRKTCSKLILEYEKDISSMLSNNWYLQGYYNTVPLALASDEELKAIFTPKELETVRTRCLGNSQQYADMIKQQHGARVKIQK